MVLAVLPSLAQITACSEASIQVHFDIPDDYRSDIQSVVLRVLEPTGLETFDCDDIAFDRVADEVERASLRQEIAVRAGSSLDLSGIPRLGQKLFWVQALGAEGKPILAGCQGFGDISGQASVRVVGEPTTIVTTDQLSPVGAPLPASVELFVTDTRLQPLSGIDVAWTVITSADEFQTGSSRTQGGVVEITPGRPAAAGPALLDIRARWQQVALPPISGFEPVEPILQIALPGTSDGVDLSRTEALYTVGPIGPEGQMGFAALGPVSQGTNQRQVLFVYRDNDMGGSSFRTVTSDPIDNLALFASIARLNRGVRDTVIVSTGGMWHEVTADGQVKSIGSGSTNVVRKLIQAGSCERDSDMLLATVIPQGGGEDTLIAIGADGAVIPTTPFTDNPPSSRPLGAGCVSGIDDQLYRTVVFHAEGALRPFIADIDGPRLGEVVSFAGSVGFVPKIGDNPAAFLGVSIDIDGASISRYQLALGGQGELEPLLIAEDPSLTFVRAMRGGDLDGDGHADVAALLDFGIDDLQRSRTRLQLVMSTEYQGQRLLGVSSELSGDDPQLYLADFDGDGSDDLLLADRESAAILPGIRRP